MATNWVVTTAAERITLDDQRKGETTFTVTNPGPAFDRAVFLHPSESLRVHVLDRSAPLLLEADGQRVAELNAGDCIQFATSETPARILRLQPQGFYERARRKLQLTDSSELAPQ